jgi:sugar phosphate isomerase/epimerase
MNNPMLEVVEEIELFAELGFEFIDLTLEPAAAYAPELDIRAVKDALKHAGLGIVGHTAYYLPIASPFPDVRESAVREMEKCLRVFHELGATMMNVHPHTKIPLHRDDWIRDQNIAALDRLNTHARRYGMQVIVENTPDFSRVMQLRPLFEAIPELGFHLDVGHANLNSPYNRSEELITNFTERLVHVHVSDNRGGHDDLHLPLGVGNINWAWAVKLLKNAGFDGTITIEVFADDEDYLLMSRDKLRKLWDTVEI